MCIYIYVCIPSPCSLLVPSKYMSLLQPCPVLAQPGGIFPGSEGKRGESDRGKKLGQSTEEAHKDSLFLAHFSLGTKRDRFYLKIRNPIPQKV